MNRKIFTNVTLIILIIALAAILGYVALAKKSNTQELRTKNSQTSKQFSSSTSQNQENIDSFVDFFCNKDKFPVHITKGEYFESSGAINQFFVYCEVPQEIPIPSLYLIEQRKSEWGGFRVYWSKLFDSSSEPSSPEKPEIIDVDKDGLSEIYWSGTTRGGTCAPHSISGFLFSGRYFEEISITRSYEFDSACVSPNVLKETTLTPGPLLRGLKYTQFYDYLEERIPVAS